MKVTLYFCLDTSHLQLIRKANIFWRNTRIEDISDCLLRQIRVCPTIHRKLNIRGGNETVDMQNEVWAKPLLTYASRES